ncbi:MAG: 50S ribosomal protein L5 [Chitinispirillales bacterium]|jgi:large subunit ribosomal protein L5|nr:50S ribosomal protein L5 [Chitinispirillales bacterium]
MPRLQKKYLEKILPVLKEELKLDNVMAIPKIDKIVLNMGVGEAVGNKRYLEDAVYTLTMVSGQKPVVTKAKKAISNFKLREGLPIGCMVTLRGKRMYEFLDRLISVTLPRVKDFKGISGKAFDGRGNYSFGIQENIVFMEVDRDKIANILGLQVTICTTAGSNESARVLLEKFGMPFRK